MLRKGSGAVSEGNRPVHQEEEFGFGQPALADEYRQIRSLSKQQEIRLDKITRKKTQLSACLEHDSGKYILCESGRCEVYTTITEVHTPGYMRIHQQGGSGGIVTQRKHECQTTFGTRYMT